MLFAQNLYMMCKIDLIATKFQRCGSLDTVAISKKHHIDGIRPPGLIEFKKTSAVVIGLSNNA